MQEKTKLNSVTSASSQSPILETTRYFIRAFEKSDLTAFAQYRADENVARYQSWTNYTYQDALRLFNQMDYSTFGRIGHWYQLAIEKKSSHEVIGDLAVHFIDQEKMEVGFTISADNQRKGVGFEALSALLDFLFLTLNKQKIVAFVDMKNEASYKLLEKAGFKRAANLKADTSPQAGWGDEYFYMKLRSMHINPPA
ncbi:GNAT family N-acetyltransferase [Vibrio algarum]|uniref:GNAT family protein n=1 Tax=Vibrio algarum TaxID=3020714 RepID=A0ABT4YWQ6_9VIBR|nr:GNAT family protein [Vibrio sp. KJ40-1]MDB1125820.1 GNAT family protein [Vibrio sp. KJ40-1]